jgi:hypothetical protein
MFSILATLKVIIIIPRAKRANEVSERSEWNGRKFIQIKILARPYRGRGGMASVCLSVCLSVRPSVTETLLNNFGTDAAFLMKFCGPS